ncbi:MAG: hypothetical protein D6806_18285, partial [Deltaproteobacteria bacterium]
MTNRGYLSVLVALVTSSGLAACGGGQAQVRRKPSPGRVAAVRANADRAFDELAAAERGEPQAMSRQEAEKDLEKPMPPKPVEEQPPAYQPKPLDNVKINP